MSNKLLRGFPVGVIPRGGAVMRYPTDIVYILRDLFTTDAAAPISSPRNCEPGPGQMIIDADTTNSLAIASGALSQTSAGAATNPRYHFTALTRAAGLLCRIKGIKYILDAPHFSPADGVFSSLAFANIAAHYAKALSVAAGDIGNVYFWAVGETANLYYVFFTTGVAAFYRNPLQEFGVASLAFVYEYGTEATLYLGSRGPGQTQKATEAAARLLGNNWLTLASIASVSQTNPANGATGTCKPNLISRMKVTLPGSPAAGDYAEMRWRRIGANDYMAMRIEWNDGTSQWDIKINEVVGGVATARQTLANAGTVTELQARAWNNLLQCWYRTTTYTGTGGTLANSVGLWASDVEISYLNVTPTLWQCFPFQQALYNNLDDYGASEKTFLPVGDSKTDLQSWIPQLSDKLSTASHQYWHEDPRQIGLSGSTWAAAATNITAVLAQMPSNSFNDALVNFGANDVSGLPAEATIKASINSVLDQLHTKSAAATLRIMRPWRRGYAAACNTLAGYIADVVAARSDSALGPDERVWLEGGDDGATMSSDGIHYSAAGLTECATQWKTSMGY